VFSSLDRADIVLKPGADGRQQYAQTDHRAPEEMEQDPELSTLFALVRVLNPKRMAGAGSPEAVVLYAAQHRPPEFLRRAIRAAGGLLTLGSSSQTEPDEGGAPPLEEVLGSAFTNLARAVAAEHNVAVDPSGLEVVERALAGAAGNPEEDELAYWSAVVKLGGFAGEVIRASNGGRWVVVESGTLPFALSATFRGEQATVNPLGKAIKRFTNGEEDSLVFLVNVIRSQP
jgi:hypothetical protein